MTSLRQAFQSRVLDLHLSRNVSILLLAAFFVTFGVFMAQPYLIARLPAYTGASDEVVSRSFMIASLVGSSLALFCSLFSDRINLTGMARFSSAALVLSFVLIELTGKVTTAFAVLLLFFGFLLFRFSLSLLRTCTFSMYSLSASDPSSLPRIFALSTSLVAIGSAMGPLLAGLLVNFETILLTSIFVLSLAAFSILFIKLPDDKLAERQYIAAAELTKRKPGRRAFKPATLGVAASSTAIYLLIAQNFSYLPVVITADNAQSADAAIARLFAFKAALLAIFPFFLTKFLERRINRLDQRYLVGLFSAFIGISVFTGFHEKPLVPYLSIIFLAIGEMVAGTYSQVLIGKTVQDADDLPAAMGLLTFATLAFGIGVGQYLGIYVLRFASGIHLMLWGTIVFGGLISLRLNSTQSALGTR